MEKAALGEERTSSPAADGRTLLVYQKDFGDDDIYDALLNGVVIDAAGYGARNDLETFEPANVPGSFLAPVRGSPPDRTRRPG